jgi:predicted esterase
MSLITGATCHDRLGGIFGLSCYMPMPGKFRSMVPEDNPNKDTPIFMGHGEADPLVKLEWGKETARLLQEWGWSVELKTYP